MPTNSILVDMDRTLCLAPEHTSNPNRYADAVPNLPLANRLRQYKADGFLIKIFTARGMYSLDGNLESIKSLHVPMIRSWLEKYDIPFDEIIIGKPWVGPNGFLIDDRAVRPWEAVNLSYNEIQSLLLDHEMRI